MIYVRFTCADSPLVVVVVTVVVTVGSIVVLASLVTAAVFIAKKLRLTSCEYAIIVIYFL